MFGIPFISSFFDESLKRKIELAFFDILSSLSASIPIRSSVSSPAPANMLTDLIAFASDVSICITSSPSAVLMLSVPSWSSTVEAVEADT